MNKLKDLLNGMKYKRKFNTYKTKYDEVLENKVKDKEKIIDLQNDLLAAKDKITKLEEELKWYKKDKERGKK